MRLQEGDATQLEYDRPSDDWICGHAAEGRPCRRGPDAEGRCRTKHECEPARSGSGWKCTRSESAGGPCEGPLPDGRCSLSVPPCVPLRSRRRRARVVGRSALIAVFGFAVLALASWQSGRWLSPGALSSAHGSVTECASCHAGFEAGGSALSKGLLGPDEDAISSGCLVCHDLGKEPLQPHGRSESELAALAAAGSPSAFVRSGFGASRWLGPDRQGRTPCETCHGEHGGRENSLVPSDDKSCRGCHFDSFGRDHPQLAPVANPMDGAVFFDHRAHFGRHFADSKIEAAPTTCPDCHLLENNGQMEVRAFRETCGLCHSGQIDGRDRSPGDRAIPLLTLPGLDTDTLEEAGFDAGSWPFYAEWELSPLLEHLLATGPETREDLETLAGVDLLDLSTQDDPVLFAATRIARAIKGLLYDLGRSGPRVLVERLEGHAGEDLPDDLVGGLLAGLSRDSVVAAQQEWFPELEAEVTRFRYGAALRPRSPSRAREGSAEEAVSPASAPDTSLLEEDLLSGDDDLLAADDDLLAGGDDLLAGDDDLLAGNDELLAGGDDLLSGGDDLLGGASGDDLLAGGDDLSAGSEEESWSASEASGVEEAALRAEDWSGAGGFYLQDFGIWYRPARHADPVVRAWMDLAGRLAGDSSMSSAVAWLERWSDRNAPGACGKCHRQSEGALVWSPRQRVGYGFTRFAHTPHLGVAGGRGCFTCHRPEEARSPADEAATRETVGSGFAGLEQALCVDCHVARAVGESCTLCHRYHPEPPRPVVPATSIGDFAKR